jgi:hypothetical protein
MSRSIYAPGSVVKLLQQAPRHRGPGRVGIVRGRLGGSFEPVVHCQGKGARFAVISLPF